MRRGTVCNAASAVASQYSITSKDVLLHVLPVHHATGLGINLFPFLLSGACIEFKSGNFDPAWMWERWRQGGLTFFSGVPTMYMRMMRFYQQNIAKLPGDVRASYVKGANQFRALLCGSSALPRPMQEFWTRIRGGRIILTRYGATEFGAVFKVEAGDKGTPEGSVGKVVSGIDIKLSNGDEGEILVKSPSMFSKSVALAVPLDMIVADCEKGTFLTIKRPLLHTIKMATSALATLDIEWVHTISLMAEYH